MKRYGIMGGTFNPIHLAHLYIAYEAKEQLNLDKVIFIPTGNPPHKKDNKIIHSNFRYEMVKKAIEDYENFTISDYEIKKEGYSYTYETLKHFKEDGVELFFIAGGDSLDYVDKWRNPQEVLKNCTFVVFNRGNFDKDALREKKIYLEGKYNANIVLLHIINMDVSSSIIRDRIKEGKRVDFFLPSKVLHYIQNNSLYEGDYYGRDR